MHFGVFDLFRIGVGPSSSHTVGPMRAARLFLERVDAGHGLERVFAVRAEAYGSLALTGSGHATDRAILWGFEGVEPERPIPTRFPPGSSAFSPKVRSACWIGARSLSTVKQTCSSRGRLACPFTPTP